MESNYNDIKFLKLIFRLQNICMMQIKMISICRFRWAIIDTATTISYWYHYLHTSCVSNRIWIFCWFPSSMHYSSTMIGIFKFCPNKIWDLFSSKIGKIWFKSPNKVTYWLKMVTSSIWVKFYNIYLNQIFSNLEGF